MINKKELFKNAWTMAKNAAFQFGGKPVEYFAGCLKERWAFEKRCLAPKAKAERVAVETKVIRIKDWFVDKNFDLQDFEIYSSREAVETLEETAKAVFVKITGSFGRSFKRWIPKSCLA